MGKKGEKRTGIAKQEAEAVTAELSGLGVSARGMFGGYGLFRQGVMFGLVNAAGELHLQVDEVSKLRFEAEDASPHGRMPYYTVPERVRIDSAELVLWATQASDIALAAKEATR